MPCRPHPLTSVRYNRKSITRAGGNDLFVGSQPAGTLRAARRRLQGRGANHRYLRSQWTEGKLHPSLRRVAEWVAFPPGRGGCPRAQVEMMRAGDAASEVGHFGGHWLSCGASWKARLMGEGEGRVLQQPWWFRPGTCRGPGGDLNTLRAPMDSPAGEEAGGPVCRTEQLNRY